MDFKYAWIEFHSRTTTAPFSCMHAYAQSRHMVCIGKSHVHTHALHLLMIGYDSGQDLKLMPAVLLLCQ